MKKIIYILCLYAVSVKAQVYNYTDLGILLSTENTAGTARFAGLNGAMGALGGDVSTLNINPAGIAVFNHHEASFTLEGNHYQNKTNYYSNTTNNKYSKYKIGQLGAVFVLDEANDQNDWSKFSFAINYQKTNNFYTRDLFLGNSNITSFTVHPKDDASYEYNNTVSQSFDNTIDGGISKVNLAFAGQYQQNIYAGFGLNIHTATFTQSTRLNELNNDGSGNTLDALIIHTNTHNAIGASINMGLIYKPIHQIRLGISFESPTWYNVIEDYSSEELIANIEGRGVPAADPYQEDFYIEYQRTTPSKITASSAIIIGKYGLVSADYTYMNYNTLSLDGRNEFRQDNQYFTDVLTNTHNLNAGAEFRFKNISFRGGVGFKQSPFKKGIDPKEIDVLKLGDFYNGSLGIGLRFKSSRIDVAYQKSKQTNEYDFYDQSEFIKTASIKNNNSRVMASYVVSF